MANLKITLVKSTIGAIPKHKKTVAALSGSTTVLCIFFNPNASTVFLCFGMAPMG